MCSGVRASILIGLTCTRFLCFIDQTTPICTKNTDFLTRLTYSIMAAEQRKLLGKFHEPYFPRIAL